MLPAAKGRQPVRRRRVSLHNLLANHKEQVERRLGGQLRKAAGRRRPDMDGTLQNMPGLAAHAFLQHGNEHERAARVR